MKGTPSCIAVTVGTAVWLACAACAGALPDSTPGAAPTLLVLSPAARTLTSRSAADRTAIAQTPTGPQARGLTLTADGPLAAAIDADGLKVWQVRPDGLVPLLTGPLPDGRALCFVDRGTLLAGAYGGLVRVEVPSGTTYPVLPIATHRLAWSPSRRRLAALGARAVTVCSLDDPATTRREVALSSRPSHVACAPDTGEFWLTLPGEEQLAVVAVDGRLLRTLAVPGAPAGIAFGSDGGIAFVACPADDTVLGIDTATGRTTLQVSIHGDGSELSALPTELVVASDGNRIFVACHRGEFLAVIDVPRARVAHRVALAAGSAELALLTPP